MKLQGWITLLLLAAVIVTSFGITGCAAPGRTKEQVHRDHVSTFSMDMLQLQDDIDTVLMIDRPNRLSPYITR